MLDRFALWRRTGPLASLQFSAAFRKRNRAVHALFGSHKDPATIERIVRFCACGRLRKDLTRLCIGLCPYRCELMEDQVFDEFYLAHAIGPRIEYFTVGDLGREAESIPEAEVRGYAEALRDRCEIDGVGEESLLLAARAQMAFEHVIVERGFEVVAFYDIVPEIYQTLGVRPALDTSGLYSRGILVGVEGDVLASLGMFLLHRLSGNPAMFLDLLTFDPSDNSILGGHPGPVNSLLAGTDGHVRITPDVEMVEVMGREGAQLELVAHPGPVTFLSMTYSGGAFRLAATSGRSTGEYRLRGYPTLHAILDVPLQQFYEEACTEGVSHHWAAVHGNLIDELRVLAEVLGLHLKVIE